MCNVGHRLTQISERQCDPCVCNIMFVQCFELSGRHFANFHYYDKYMYVIAKEIIHTFPDLDRTLSLTFVFFVDTT